jgi:hypothetical protein
MPCWPMPAVRNLTHKGSWNTYCWVRDTSFSGHTVSSNGGKSKKFERWLCMRKNLFRVCSAGDEIRYSQRMI